MADTITEEEKEAASEAGITVFTMAEIKVCRYGGHNSLYLLSFTSGNAVTLLTEGEWKITNTHTLLYMEI